MKIISILTFLVLTVIFYKKMSGNNNSVQQKSRYHIEFEKTLSLDKDNVIRGFPKKLPDGSFQFMMTASSNSGKLVGGTYIFDHQPQNYLVTISPQGDIISSKPIPENYPFFKEEEIKFNDNYYAITTKSSRLGAPEYLAKYDKSRKLLWSKGIRSGGHPDFNTQLALTENRQFLIAGYGNDSVSVDIYSPEGEIVSHKSYPHYGNTGPRTLIKTSDNKYLVTAYAYDNVQPVATWLLKLNANGDTLWTKTIPNMMPKETIETRDGSLVVYGTEYSDENSLSHESFKIVKVEKNGDILWTKKIKENYIERPGDVIETTSGNYLFSCSIEPIRNGGKKAYIFELDKAGNRVYENKFEYSLGGEIPFLIKNDKLILMLSQKYIGKFGDPHHHVILITSLKEQ